MPAEVTILRVTADTSGTLESLDKFTQDLDKNIINNVEKAGAFLEGKMVEKIMSGLNPALKPETIARKKSSTPLIDRGELLSQIDHRMDGKDTVEVGVFGSKAKIAVHHEFGTPKANIPERSFMRSTFNEQKPKLVKIIKGN